MTASSPTTALPVPPLLPTTSSVVPSAPAPPAGSALAAAPDDPVSLDAPQAFGAFDVVGYGLYLELECSTDDQVACSLFLPAGIDAKLNLVPASIYYRTLLPGTTPFWSSVVSRWSPPIDSDMEFVSADEWETQEQLDGPTNAEKFAAAHIQGYKDNGFTVRIAPLVIEVTRFDLGCVKASSTPSKALARVQAARLKAGFPVSPNPKPSS